MFDPVRERRLQLWLGSGMLLGLLALVIGLTALGDRTFAGGFSIHADFSDLNNLTAGSKVQVAGVTVGRVLALHHQSGPQKARVRAVFWIERRYADRVRRNGRALVTSVGVVGRRYVEILPPTGEPGPVCSGGEVLRGVDTPKIDRLIERGFTQVKAFAALAREVDPQLVRLGQARRGLSKTVSDLGGPQRGKALVARLSRLGGDASALWGDFAPQLAEPQRSRTAASLAALLQRTDQVQALLDRARTQLDRAEELSGLWSAAQREQLARSGRRLDSSLSQTRAALSTMATLWAHVLQGNGTVGRILTDPELVDEIRQTHRIIKEQPQRAVGRGK